MKKAVFGAVGPIDIGSRLELFVDCLLVEKLRGVRLCLHEPREAARPANPLSGDYMTVIRDGDLYRGYYRAIRRDYEGKKYDGHPGEVTCYAESDDGVEWRRPDLGLSLSDAFVNAVLAEAPFSHNFCPFLDRRPGIPPGERYKALAGTHRGGLWAFTSPDGIRWRRSGAEPVLRADPELHERLSFDSQNLAWWSEAERCYVAWFRHWKTPHGHLRSIGRATSDDFIHWRDESATFAAPNRPGEQLYTSQAHPYFRAPHIYIALPTRFMHGRLGSATARDEKGQTLNIGSTDILFMSARAGARRWDRLFPGAFIPPGLEPARWGNRANYAALNVVPTGPTEMSVYHKDGGRFTLRTDGFVSARAGAAGGELLTRPLVYDGRELAVNYGTSAAGSLRVEIRRPDNSPVPGFRLADCLPATGDEIERTVAWRSGPDLGALAGRPVRLRFVMAECDLYAFQFRNR